MSPLPLRPSHLFLPARPRALHAAPNGTLNCLSDHSVRLLPLLNVVVQSLIKNHMPSLSHHALHRTPLRPSVGPRATTSMFMTRTATATSKTIESGVLFNRSIAKNPAASSLHNSTPLLGPLPELFTIRWLRSIHTFFPHLTAQPIRPRIFPAYHLSSTCTRTKICDPIIRPPFITHIIDSSPITIALVCLLGSRPLTTLARHCTCFASLCVFVHSHLLVLVVSPTLRSFCLDRSLLCTTTHSFTLSFPLVFLPCCFHIVTHVSCFRVLLFPVAFLLCNCILLSSVQAKPTIDQLLVHSFLS